MQPRKSGLSQEKGEEGGRCEAEEKEEGHESAVQMCADGLRKEQDQGNLSHVTSVLLSIQWSSKRGELGDP